MQMTPEQMQAMLQAMLQQMTPEQIQEMERNAAIIARFENDPNYIEAIGEVGDDEEAKKEIFDAAFQEAKEAADMEEAAAYFDAQNALSEAEEAENEAEEAEIEAQMQILDPLLAAEEAANDEANAEADAFFGQL